MQVETNGEFGWFIRVLPLIVGISALAYVLTQPARNPAPSNTVVFGCYAASNGPAILLDGSGMHVRQVGFPAIPFHLERSKTGILLTADVPIRADKTAGGYHFGINERGVGWYLPFYRLQDGRAYGVFDEKSLEGFQMLASDGVDLNYNPTDATRCAQAS